MITLYETAASPTCRAVKLALKILGLDFEIKTVDLMKQEQREPAFLKMNPFHTVPVLDDNGFIVCESRAILTYLVNKHAPDSDLYPKDPEKRATVDQWLHTDNGNIFTNSMEILHPYFAKQEPSKEARDKASDSLKCLDGVLAGRLYVTGEHLTLADLSVATSLSGYEMADYDISEYSNITKYMSRVRSKLSPTYEEVNDGPVAGLKQFVINLKKLIEK